MPNNVAYYDHEKVMLKRHHMKNSVWRRIQKGYINIYDVTVEDLLKTKYDYLKIARERDLFVTLTLQEKTRILIFNRKYHAEC